MREIKVYTSQGEKIETVYKINEVSWISHLFSCDDVKKRKISYLNIPCAFDIETANISEQYAKDHNLNDGRPFSFMYHWQFCINTEVVFGHTWEEFKQLIKTASRALNLFKNNRLVIYCHNLAFEFQHFRRFVNVIGGFYKEKYKPLSVVLDCGIEFRDSLALTNMSLDKFLQQENAIYQKNDGEKYDYMKLRTPSTPMNEVEESYCYCDVRGLCEGIKSLMQEYDLAKIPLTSTGYVRREARINMRKNKKNREIFKQIALDLPLYNLMRDAFRGGDTHANLLYVNQVIEDVKSRDIQSSYPTSMVTRQFPMGRFEKIDDNTFENYDLTGYAYILRIRMTEVRYIGNCGNPYIPESKCKSITAGRVIDNGRILYTKGLEMAVTDIDLKIILHDYDFEDIYYSDIYISRYGYLPKEYTDTVIDYYMKKTSLKGIDEYYYMKSKNKLNALYGMMVTNIVQDITIYENGGYIEVESKPEELLEKYYKRRNSFLSYQWGIWVTAHSRYMLRQALWAVGSDVVYCDTDSVKYIGDHDDVFNDLNAKALKIAKERGAYAIDSKGNTQYMGIWDDDGHYDRFKTLGAKKYCIDNDGDVKTTIAGVSKVRGRRFFSKLGIEEFKIGTEIKDAGHLVAYYNDDEIHDITIEGDTFTTASNIALLEGGYKIGVSNEYYDLLMKSLDNAEIIL